jgi:hypothetical protein
MARERTREPGAQRRDDLAALPLPGRSQGKIGSMTSKLMAHALMPAIAAVGALLPLCTRAASDTELWPELSAFVQLNDRARVYLDASASANKESNTQSLDASAFVDLSIQPIFRGNLRTEDWQRSRYLWARMGYTRVFKVEQGTREVVEDRGVLAIYGRAPLPADVWLEVRTRADLRWIGDAYSTRYRLRLDASREFNWFEHTVVPYANAEAFYDTRYDGWARTLYQAGAELTLSKRFRVELYLARQVDRLPSKQSVNAPGIVAKWYF